MAQNHKSLDPYEKLEEQFGRELRTPYRTPFGRISAAVSHLASASPAIQIGDIVFCSAIDEICANPALLFPISILGRPIEGFKLLNLVNFFQIFKSISCKETVPSHT
ncbi:unnamed protein product [Ceratitis capitata]|uniref:(Mediterranean fruit fly) hypothetical protein n=1 Tax=Ceratitis capitata TaxID=7213 RepID=A0A811VCY7_CERCA|nr:unnamed protein product [Ceratitis capitata]